MRISTGSRNIYRLPFDKKIDVRPAPFHYEGIWQRNAVDFALEVGTPILAAGGGVVTRMQDGHAEGALKRRYLGKSNFVMIKHKYGEDSHYVHLRKGIQVSEGQEVKEGQLIGYSGLSGFTSYPHLHFAITAYLGLLTIPARFRENGHFMILCSPKHIGMCSL